MTFIGAALMQKFEAILHFVVVVKTNTTFGYQARFGQIGSFPNHTHTHIQRPDRVHLSLPGQRQMQVPTGRTCFDGSKLCVCVCHRIAGFHVLPYVY